MSRSSWSLGDESRERGPQKPVLRYCVPNYGLLRNEDIERIVSWAPDLFSARYEEQSGCFKCPDARAEKLDAVKCGSGRDSGASAACRRRKSVSMQTRPTLIFHGPAAHSPSAAVITQLRDLHL